MRVCYRESGTSEARMRYKATIAGDLESAAKSLRDCGAHVFEKVIETRSIAFHADEKALQEVQGLPCVTDCEPHTA
jgi:hypothetical protein